MDWVSRVVDKSHYGASIGNTMVINQLVVFAADAAILPKLLKVLIKALESLHEEWEDEAIVTSGLKGQNQGKGIWMLTNETLQSVQVSGI